MVERLATILNVNDHEQTRYVVSRMLRLAGYEVLEAATGEEALRVARERPIDLVVLDVKLPDVSGFEVARMLKGSAATSSILVLHTSATFVTIEKRVEGLESGADGYITHPFEPAELLATVKALLRLRRAEQELRRRADDLVEADRRKDEFLAMLAHELRNPLAAITTAASLLEVHRHDSERFRHVRNVIERQSRHLGRLIDDLLDVSRITRGRIELKPETLGVAGVLKEAAQMCRPVLESRGQSLELRLGGEELLIQADATRIQQVFANLLDNASKYSAKGAFIELLLERHDKHARPHAVVRVRDEGIGIEPQALPHVFELFFQVDESLERTRGGMGIGLTLVKRLVELHAGEVRVRSEGLGKGSEFEVWLPIVQGAVRVEPTAPAVSEPAPASDAGPWRILLIEDNEDAREAMQSFLEVEGHVVETTGDGLTGVELALSGHFDFAIVDVGLPGLNGYQVAERIRASPQGAKMYLIALTGYSGTEQRKRALASGFNIHLVKPPDPDALLKVLATGRR
ncbi:MAG TPA: response regulator [Polyangia bacterium]|jgi:signal transduction histidine kinase|nr:response regulator [Polyangia bacterium]